VEKAVTQKLPMTKPPHMSPEEFRKHGYEAIDWITRYMEDIERYPVLSQSKPGETRDKLPPNPPEKGESFETMLADFDNLILPGITHWQSPNFFAYFPANTSGPSILGELLTAGLGVQGMIWATSPACTELESHVLDWLVNMLGLPDKFKTTDTGGGVIQDSASSASLCALLTARERATKFKTNQNGVDKHLIAYTSEHTHSSIEKAIKVAGIGQNNLRLIEVDEQYAMRPEILECTIKQDLEAGYTPFFVCATIGTTSSTAVDPVSEIGKICRVNKIWMHVDAALAGSAALCPEFRWLHDGMEFADSYCFNPHKWMLTNFDCDCLYVGDRAALNQTLGILPEYLRNSATDSGTVIDYRDWQIPLGRRFRALKLWFVIRYYGIEGLGQHIRHHVKLASDFAKWVETDKDFVLEAPTTLNLVCFRHKAGDAFNQCLVNRLNASGELYLTHTKLDGRFTLRMAIGSTLTEYRHVKSAWKMIQNTANLQLHTSD